MEQMRENRDHYVWTNIKSLDELEHIRMSAMELFLSDFERGKAESRYLYHELPNQVSFPDYTFDIGLSSHFLLLYTSLGYEFHIHSITEMLRVCKEIRIFPVVDLDARKTDLIASVIEHFKQSYFVEIKETEYEFQKGANKVLIIKNTDI